MTVTALTRCLDVTATAVRQRLARLQRLGLVERRVERYGRGRPRHRYRLTPVGERCAGSNFADLARVLWQELRQIGDRQIRRGLLRRIAQRMAGLYGPQVQGSSVRERMQQLVEVFRRRDIPVQVDRATNGGPVLTVLACPYPDLAEEDRAVCAMERLMFSEVLGTPLQLTQCRLEGASCCSFATR